jgi:hypothetical protein
MNGLPCCEDRGAAPKTIAHLGGGARDQSRRHTRKAAVMKIELTIFTNSDNKPLTKCISLREDGRSVKSDSSACLMSRGSARRLRADIMQFSTLLGNCRPDQAFALGRLRTGLPDQVEITTKS